MKHSGTPWVVLVATLLLTLAAAALLSLSTHDRNRTRFESATRMIENRINGRMQAYVGVLRATAGFFGASEWVDRDEFREYFRHIDVQTTYPGIQGVGFAQRVAREQVRDLVEDMQAAGARDFDVFPRQPERAWYYPIVYLEPGDVRNLAAIGYDMFSEPVRRDAMERARDTGLPAMSGKVRLVQELEDRDAQPGFLIYLPIYDEPTGVTSTPEQRDALLLGFVYSPFRAYDLFDAAFRDEPNPGIRFRIFDGFEPDTASLLYDSAPTLGEPSDGSFSARDTVRLAGRSWLVDYTPMPAFGVAGEPPLVPIILVTGLMLSILLFGLTRAQAQARARAENMEAIRTRFFAAMSHELRTPINAIMGYIDLLLSGVYGELSPPQRAGLERGQKAARHLAELVTDVLDLSKIEAGKIELEYQLVSLSGMVDDVLPSVQPLAATRGSPLEFVPCGDLPEIVTDPRRVRQILLNLLSNAAKFGESRPITIRCERADGGLRVAVTDRGDGISQRDLDRIFEEFVQLAPAGEGTGLGLAISRRLADLLGGRLEVRSEPGRGSTFALWLPLEPPDYRANGAAPIRADVVQS